MDKENINKLRNLIDKIDNQLLKLIIERSSVVEKIGKFKDSKKTVEDKQRENQVIKRLIKLHKGNFPKDSLVRLWREIFDASVKIQLNNQNNLAPKRKVDSTCHFRVHRRPEWSGKSKENYS